MDMHTQTRHGARLIAALLLGGLAFAAHADAGSDRTSDAKARYESERAACLNGSSNEDRKTCLKEAGAAYEEARRGKLDNHHDAYDQNAYKRCDAQPAEDRDACRRRIQGEGSVTGSVEAGGILREITVPEKK